MTTDHEQKYRVAAEPPLAQRYENLRDQVLSGTYRFDRACDLGTLLSFGLCAWINDARSDLSDQSDNPPQPSACQIQTLHRQLGSVIADMLIA
jgi:hypothetical protein